MLHKRGAAYSQDLRERVFAAAAGGTAVGQIAQALRTSSSYISKVLGRLRSTGERTARPQRCQVQPKLAHLHPAIREQVMMRPDITITELRTWLLETHKIYASEGLISKTLKLLGLTYKKSRFAPRSRTARTSRRRAPNGATTSRS